MTAATIRALGDRFDHLRAKLGRDIAIEDLAETLSGKRRRPAGFEFVDPAGQAVVLAVCKAHGGSRWEELHAELTKGRLKTRQLTRVREEATFILGDLGFSDSEIAILVNRERSSIVTARQRFLAREGSDIERARIARILETVRGEPPAPAGQAVAS